MGTVYIFRGKAATGKSTLSDMLAQKLSIPVIRKDDIVDALKSTESIDKQFINNEVCYNILYSIIQTNLSLNADFILDIALGDRKNAMWFFNRLNFTNSNVIKFFIDCSDKVEWERRHIERLKNPLPHQSFKSLEHIYQHYNSANVNPFDDEYVIDTAKPLKVCFEEIESVILNSDTNECNTKLYNALT